MQYRFDVVSWLRREMERMSHLTDNTPDGPPSNGFGTWDDFDLTDDHRSVGEDELKNRFGSREATAEGPNATAPRHAYLRAHFLEFADMLDRLLPPGRAKAVALTQLEDSAMWANKAISALAED